MSCQVGKGKWGGLEEAFQTQLLQNYRVLERDEDIAFLTFERWGCSVEPRLLLKSHFRLNYNYQHLSCRTISQIYFKSSASFSKRSALQKWNSHCRVDTPFSWVVLYWDNTSKHTTMGLKGNKSSLTFSSNEQLAFKVIGKSCSSMTTTSVVALVWQAEPVPYNRNRNTFCCVARAAIQDLNE